VLGAAIETIMRLFSYLYHGLLALFLLAISALALLSSGVNTLSLDFLPWQGSALSYWLLGASLFGIVSLVLAVKGVLRGLYFLWNLVVVLVLVKGLFLSSHHFEPGEFKTAVYLTLGALLALAGAWIRLRQPTDPWSRT